ncbi:MAG: repressor LexA [Parachlamydiaceae bacterium]|nr:MAG: repressor LexA [Parachlamydiaceae bacterium]
MLQYIKGYLQAHQYAPSYREIMQYFSFSSLGTVYRYVQVLKKKGLLEQQKHSSRALTLLEESQRKSELSLPFIGSISAGEPLTMFPKSQSLDVPLSMVPMPEATYVLQVRGDGLVDELMADGDYLLVEARQEAVAGDTVVALLNQNDMVVRKYYHEEPYVRLVSLHPHTSPIIVQEDDLMIQGVVVALLRHQISSSSSSGSGS